VFCDPRQVLLVHRARGHLEAILGGPRVASPGAPGVVVGFIAVVAPVQGALQPAPTIDGVGGPEKRRKRSRGVVDGQGVLGTGRGGDAGAS